MLTLGTAGTSGYATKETPGFKPQYSPLFNSFFKVVTVKALELTAGATERVNFDIALEHLVKSDENASQIATGNIYSPSTYMVMTVTRGAPIYDKVANLATYGVTKVGCVMLTRYECCAVAGGNSNRLNTNVVINRLFNTSATGNAVLLNNVDQSSSAVII